MSQKDIIDEKYKTMDQLATRDREVKMMTKDKPQWEEDEAIFHFFCCEDKATGYTMKVRQTTTSATMWQEAQRVISLIDKKAKLQSIHVALDMVGNIEEFTSTSVGSQPLGELAKHHRKITLQSQRTVQQKEKLIRASQAQILGVTVKSWSAHSSETSQEPQHKKGRNDPSKNRQPTEEQDKGSEKWAAMERQQTLLLKQTRDDNRSRQEKPEGADSDPQGDFLAQIDAQKHRDQAEEKQHSGITKVSVSESDDSDQEREGSTPSDHQLHEKYQEEASKAQADFGAAKTSASPEESPEQRTKRRCASAITDRDLNLRQTTSTAIDHISVEACERCMQTIEVFDEQGQGSTHKRKKLETKIQGIIDEDAHKQRQSETEGLQEAPQENPPLRMEVSKQNKNCPGSMLN